MMIDEIREQIAISLNRDCHDQWITILDGATPGNYGVDDLEFSLGIKDIWVDVPKRTFKFKNGELSFSARLMASSEEDGVDIKCRKTLSGPGTFEFMAGKGLQIVDFEVNEDIDLLDE